jgi:integrase
MDLRTIERQLRSHAGKPRPERLTIKVGPGVEARVDTAGIVSYSLRYKLNGSSTQRRVHLGTFTGNPADKGSLTPAAALAKAQALRAQARDGADVALDVQRTASGDDAPTTVAELCDRFLADHKGSLGVQHESAIRRDAENSIKPAKIGSIALGSIRIADIRKADLAALLRREYSRRTAAGLHGAASIASIRASLRSVFGYAEESGWLPANPAAGLRSPAGAKLTERERTLTDTELADLWRLLTSPGRGASTDGQRLKRDALLVILLTGTRASEVLNRQRRDFDLENSTMTITNGKTDSSNRTIPLSPVALAVVKDVLTATLSGPNTCPFPSPGPKQGGKAMTASALAKEVKIIAKSLGHTQPVIWTAHDLRRTLISWMEGPGGVSTEVVRRLVGHAAKDVHSRVYSRDPRMEDMRKAVLAYERHVAALAAPKDSNVIPINQGAAK